MKKRDSLAVRGRDNRAVPSYRPNVAAVLQNTGGQLLLGERLGFPGSWQFPQGGLHAGESAEAGLHREIWEELSLAPMDYTILDQRGPYRYLFPAGITKKGFQGQEQHYFLLRLTAHEKNDECGDGPPGTSGHPVDRTGGFSVRMVARNETRRLPAGIS